MDGPEDDRTLQNFAWVMLGASALLGVGAIRRGVPLALPVAGVAIGLALVLVSRVAPRALAGAYRAWMALGEALGRVTTPVLLLVVFVTVLLPTRLLLALRAKDPLTRRFDRAAPSYWIERPRAGFEPAHFERLW